MRLYVALELSHGGVAGVRGDPRRAGGEPMGVGGQARRWSVAGAKWAHLVDVDAARGGRSQWQHIQHALGRRLHVQFAGGVRSMTQVQQLLDLGVQRVCVGTQAVRNPLWLQELCRIFPGRITLALDARGREVLVQGRTEGTGLDVVDVARGLDDAGLASVLYAAVDDAQATGPLDRALVGELRGALRTPLVVAAQVGDGDLAWLEAAGVDAVVGDELYDGTVDLAQALKSHPDTRPEPLGRRAPSPAAEEVDADAAESSGGPEELYESEEDV